MSDEKPLRQEDYRAMAEENRRLRGEVESLRNRPARRARLQAGLRVWSRRLGLLVLCGLALWGCRVLVSGYRAHVPTQKKPCYFVRQFGWSDGYPWQPWHVYQFADVSFMGSVDERYRDTGAGDFATQLDAWNFIQKWNLEACR